MLIRAFDHEPSGPNVALSVKSEDIIRKRLNPKLELTHILITNHHHIIHRLP